MVIRDLNVDDAITMTVKTTGPPKATSTASSPAASPPGAGPGAGKAKKKAKSPKAAEPALPTVNAADLQRQFLAGMKN